MQLADSFITVVLVMVMATACTGIGGSGDYDRHRLSDLVIPHDRSDMFYFDVSLTTDLPADDTAAEGQRMRWLDEWVALRGLCPHGHEVLERRDFAFLEDNPARRDLRYEVRCRHGSGDAPP